MSEKMTTLTKFNNTVEQMMDNLIERYSYHTYFSKELIMTKERFDILRKTNPAKVIEGILVCVYPYKKQIMEEDDQFFLQKNYVDDTNNDDHLVKALRIKELWETDMDENTKKALFNYFKVFIVLAERYVGERMRK